MGIKISPKIFITWIPNGRINFIPLPFATIIALDKTSGDTLRKVAKTEANNSDTLRKIKTIEKVKVDTKRQITFVQRIKLDTLRKISKEEMFSVDTLRKIRVPDGEIVVKPFVFITWIPNGRINFTPLPLATIIALDKVGFDTLREIKKNEKINLTTIRKIINVRKINYDTQRKIILYENINSDTLRNVKSVEILKINTLRKVRIPDGNITIKPIAFATIIALDKTSIDILRRIVNDEIFRGDTQRHIKKGVCTDTVRKIVNTRIFSGDTNRNITGYDRFSGDTYRKLREKFSADTKRKVVKHERFSGDTIIRVPYILKYLIEQPAAKAQSKAIRSVLEKPVALMNTLENFGIVSLTIGLNAMALSDTFSLESATHMNILEGAQGQLFNYKFNFLVEQTSHSELMQSIEGTYNKDQQLYTQVKLDRYTLGKSLTEHDIYNLRTTNEKANLIYGLPIDDDGKITLSSITNISGNRETTFQQYIAPDGHKMSENETRRYLLAQYAFSANYIKLVANALGLKTYIKIRDFHNTQLENYLDNYITYIELLQNAYSWSSKIPQRQINVFIRDDTLYVIERGLEDDIFDISNIPHSRPIIERKLMRTTWEREISKSRLEVEETEDFEGTESGESGNGNNGENNYDDKDDYDDYDEDDYDDYDDDYDEEPTPYSGVISYNESFADGDVYMSIKYSAGLMLSTNKTITMTDPDTGIRTTTKSTTEYDYGSYQANVSGTPSGGGGASSNKTKKQTKATVYSNKKDFERAMKQWQKQKEKAERQYQRQLERYERQQRLALNKLAGQSKTIFYLMSEDTTITTTDSEGNKTEQEVFKVNRYDGIGDSTYLFEERELTRNTIYYDKKKVSEEGSTRQTFHAPCGNGYYATTTYVDGEFQSASLSQGKPFQQATQFTTDQIQGGWSGYSGGSSGGGNEGPEPPDVGPPPKYDPSKENNQNPNPAGGNADGGDADKTDKKTRYTTTYEVDSSFPTKDLAVAMELEGALQWLNRKVQEEVTVEIYGEVINGIPELQHIIDFTERVIFEGNVFFLVSNTIQLTPTKLSQNLKLVRWY